MSDDLFRGLAQGAGSPPGTLTHIGKVREDVRFHIVRYNAEQFDEASSESVDECLSRRAPGGIEWISVTGLHDVAAIEKIGSTFRLHPLVLEDILNTKQRPKLEDYADYLFLVVKVPCFVGDHTHLEQVSIILGKGYVLSFAESSACNLAVVQERIRNAKSRLRRLGADYLAYALLDMVVDNYFIMLENLGEQIERLEEKLVLDPSTKIIREIHRLKTQLLFLRKAAWPMREVVGGLGRGDTGLVEESTQLYIRDAYDHAVQAIDALETYRDMISGMLDIYLSSISHKMNEVMKVLTIISTIFMPLTFVVGLYGMNFKYMPELEWEWGYPAVLALMALISLGMYRYFKIKKWI